MKLKFLLLPFLILMPILATGTGTGYYLPYNASTLVSPISASDIDWSLTRAPKTGVYTKSIGASSVVYTFSKKTGGQTIVVRTTATSGSVTWPTVKWSASTVPTQTANGTDLCTFVYDGSSTYGSCVQDMR